MGAYKLTPCSISDSDEPISIVEAKIFNLYQNMIAAEKKDEEKTLLDLPNEVEEEQSEKQLSDGIFVHNANKTKGGKCPACGFKAPLSDEEESQSTLICDKCEAGFPGYMYVATKTNKLKGDET